MCSVYPEYLCPLFLIHSIPSRTRHPCKHGYPPCVWADCGDSQWSCKVVSRNGWPLLAGTSFGSQVKYQSSPTQHPLPSSWSPTILQEENTTVTLTTIRLNRKIRKTLLYLHFPLLKHLAEATLDKASAFDTQTLHLELAHSHSRIGCFKMAPLQEQISLLFGSRNCPDGCF